MKTLTKILSRLVRWLSNHQPVQCHLCFRWMLNKSAIYERHSTGGQVRLCQACHERIFHPFSKAGKK